MKLYQETVRADNNFGHVEQCTVQAGPKLFAMLSEKLYSEPLVAVSRELAANALDAHREAGTLDTPIQITLPHTFNTEFKIRDFGTGMTDERIRTVWSTWLNSDKNDDDDAIGGWGIGGKVGYHVADTFSIRTWVNGVRRAYSAFKDDRGIPSIALLEEVGDIEPNGVEITIPIPREQIYNFVTASHKGLRYFPAGSFVYTNEDCTPPEVNYVYKGKLCGLRKDEGYSSVANIVMGPIAYRLDPDLVLDYLKTHCTLGKDFNYGELLRSSIDLFVPQNSVMPHPNREQLEYNSLTKKTIAFLLPHVVKELSDELLGNLDIDGFPTLYELQTRCFTILNNLPRPIYSHLPAFKDLDAALRKRFHATINSFSTMNLFATLEEEERPDIYALSKEAHGLTTWEIHSTPRFARTISKDPVLVWLPKPASSYVGPGRMNASAAIWSALCKDGTHDIASIFLLGDSQSDREIINRLFGPAVTQYEFDSFDTDIGVDDIPASTFITLPAYRPATQGRYNAPAPPRPVELLKIDPFNLGQLRTRDMPNVSSDMLETLDAASTCYVYTTSRELTNDDYAAVKELQFIYSQIEHPLRIMVQRKLLCPQVLDKLHPTLVGVQSSMTKRVRQQVAYAFPSLRDYLQQLKDLLFKDDFIWEDIYLVYRLQKRNFNFDRLTDVHKMAGRYLDRYYHEVPLTKLLDDHARVPGYIQTLAKTLSEHQMLKIALNNKRLSPLLKEGRRQAAEINTIISQYSILKTAMALFVEPYSYYNRGGYYDNLIDPSNKEKRHLLYRFINQVHRTTIYNAIIPHTGETHGTTSLLPSNHQEQRDRFPRWPLQNRLSARPAIRSGLQTCG
jgi:hypothetical protein